MCLPLLYFLQEVITMIENDVAHTVTVEYLENHIGDYFIIYSAGKLHFKKLEALDKQFAYFEGGTLMHHGKGHIFSASEVETLSSTAYRLNFEKSYAVT